MLIFFFLCEQLQPENAIPISSWFDQPSDQQLLLMLPWLQVCVYVTSEVCVCYMRGVCMLDEI